MGGSVSVTEHRGVLKRAVWELFAIMRIEPLPRRLQQALRRASWLRGCGYCKPTLQTGGPDGHAAHFLEKFDKASEQTDQSARSAVRVAIIAMIISVVTPFVPMVIRRRVLA
jgi:hypothetical protein